MADTLAMPVDLQNMPGLADLADATATTLLEIATSIVQGEVQQILVEVEGDTAELLGTTDSWLNLPERPATGVTSVTLDNEDVTDYERFASRLWREDGWATCFTKPSRVIVVYDHGYATGDRRLELARSAVLMLAAGAAGPSGVRSEAIDDYQVAYEQMANRMEAAPMLRRSLRRRYRRPADLVRIG